MWFTILTILTVWVILTIWVNTKGKSRLVDSKHFWLRRPNDETRMKEKNVTVVLSKVHNWAKEIAKRIQHW